MEQETVGRGPSEEKHCWKGVRKTLILGSQQPNLKGNVGGGRDRDWRFEGLFVWRRRNGTN